MLSDTSFNYFVTSGPVSVIGIGRRRWGKDCLSGVVCCIDNRFYTSLANVISAVSDCRLYME